MPVGRTKGEFEVITQFDRAKQPRRYRIYKNKAKQITLRNVVPGMEDRARQLETEMRQHVDMLRRVGYSRAKAIEMVGYMNSPLLAKILQ